jgi:hypothetical protein
VNPAGNKGKFDPCRFDPVSLHTLRMLLVLSYACLFLRCLNLVGPRAQTRILILRAGRISCADVLTTTLRMLLVIRYACYTIRYQNLVGFRAQTRKVAKKNTTTIPLLLL